MSSKLETILASSPIRLSKSSSFNASTSVEHLSSKRKVAGTPKTAAYCCATVILGVLLPFSYRLSTCLDVFNKSAIASCVRPRSFLICFNLSPNVIKSPHSTRLLKHIKSPNAIQFYFFYKNCNQTVDTRFILCYYLLVTKRAIKGGAQIEE